MIREPDLSALSALPPIRRARFWRLYAEDGRRFLDLWQDGGRGILGAKPGRLPTAAKASIDAGLARPLPSAWTRRLLGELGRRYPDYPLARLYANEDRAAAALALAIAREGRRPQDELALCDPACPRPAGAAAADALVLRPFAAFLERPSGAFRAALPLLPCPRPFAPGILLFADRDLAAFAPPEDIVAPLATRSALDSLLALSRYESEADEAHWSRADRRLSGLFARKGPWLFPRPEGPPYAELFAKALAAGILLSPDPSHPSILPGDFDDGELAPLAAIR